MKQLLYLTWILQSSWSMTVFTFPPSLPLPPRGEVALSRAGEGDKINCHPSFSASLNVKGSSLLPSPLSKGEPEGSNTCRFIHQTYILHSTLTLTLSPQGRGNKQQSPIRRRSHNNPYNSLHSRWHTTGRSTPHTGKSCSSGRSCILLSSDRPYNCHTWSLSPTGRSLPLPHHPWSHSPYIRHRDWV